MAHGASGMLEGMQDRWDEEMHERERIPPELDPAFDDLDDGPSRTFANRMRPLIWVGAAVALAAMAAFALL